MNEGERMRRILLICRDREQLRRIATFVERRGISVLRAITPESAVNMIGLVMLDAVLVDAVDEAIVPRIRRNHPGATVVCLADQLDVETDADRILRSPVDLFVLERLLDRLDAPVTPNLAASLAASLAANLGPNPGADDFRPEEVSRERRRVDVSE